MGIHLRLLRDPMEQITPERAQELLSGSPNMRDKGLEHAQKLGQIMLAGNWNPEGSPMDIVDGMLCEGGQRCRASVLCAVSFMNRVRYWKKERRP